MPENFLHILEIDFVGIPIAFTFVFVPLELAKSCLFDQNEIWRRLCHSGIPYIQA